MATFNFWRQFEGTANTTPTASKGAFQTVYGTLQKVLVKQCHFISDDFFDMESAKKADLSEDFETFLEYRHDAKDVFNACYHVLNYDYLAHLGELLTAYTNSHVSFALLSLL